MLENILPSLAPDATAYAFRATLTWHRLIVGIFGFLAFAALTRGLRWHKLAAVAASAAVAYAVQVAITHAGSSFVGAVLTIVVAIVLAFLVATWPAAHGLFARVTFAGTILAGCLAITNFLNFHDWRWASADESHQGRFGAINYNDLFHYYLAAKYFPELSYRGLYACAAQAAFERGEIRTDWPARDLRDDRLMTVADILDQASECRAHFTDERWRSFGDDVLRFGALVDDGARMRYLTDFGYNATPFMTAIHRPLVAWTTPTETVLGILASIDAPLFMISVALLAWAFGPSVAALITLALGVGVLWVYNHIGLPGAMGRWWWVSALIAAICFARRGWFWSVGASLAAAAMLRAFPAVFLLWPAALASWQYVRTRQVAPELKRLLIGATTATAACGAISMIGIDAWSIYTEFATNSIKHASGGYANSVGLAPLLGAGPSHAMWWAAAAALAAMLTLLCPRIEFAAALLIAGIGAMFALFSITNYDYLVLALFAPFALSRPGDEERSDLLAFGFCVLIHNAIFIAAPGADRLIYSLGSAIVLGALIYFSVRWAAVGRSLSGRWPTVHLSTSLRNGRT